MKMKMIMKKDKFWYIAKKGKPSFESYPYTQFWNAFLFTLQKLHDWIASMETSE